MKKISAIIMTFMCMVNMSLAQSQQLKTLHHLQGEEDRTGLTYTGYEDELGNIIRHGAFTYQKDGASVSLNYKNNKLDGAATITITNPSYSNWKISCKMKYKEGTLLEINYEEIGEYDGYYKKVYTGKTVFKCSRNEQGLPVGDYEWIRIGSYDNEYIKGKFDLAGKATGYWTIYANDANRSEDELHPNRASFGTMGNKVYFEQGYCLGTNETTIALGRKYLIEKSISEQEMLNQGVFFDTSKIQVKYGKMAGPRDDSKCRVTEGTLHTMVLGSASAMSSLIYNRLHDGEWGQNGSIFKGLNDICPPINITDGFGTTATKSFESGSIQGTSITYMSSELYQNIVNQIKSNNVKATVKYDNQLNKYYVLKVDGKTRLYVPIEFENNFKELNSYSKEPCPSNVTDYDGNTYNTIQIGEQCWMKENLRTTHYSDGTEIKFGGYGSMPNGDNNNLISYGYLYSWQMTVNGTNGSDMLPSHIQGICPNGWHVPSDMEWQELVKVVKSRNNGNLAKSLASSSGWNYGFAGNNSTGFSVLPAGENGGRLGDNAFFWSATQDSKYTENALCFNVSRYDDGEIGLSQGWNKDYNFSVRCVRD